MVALRDDPLLRALASRSLALLLAGQDPGGAYLASPTFAPYRYGWLRDGAFCALAASRAGVPESAMRFFDWVARVVTAQEEVVHRAVVAGPGGADYLPARYALDGHRLDDGWWDDQHDGYGTWLWVMAEHQRRYGPLGAGYARPVTLVVDYLSAQWSRPSYDWWEEHGGHRHTATLAAVAAGLAAAARWPLLTGATRHAAEGTARVITRAIRSRGVRHGHLVKWLDDGVAVDASLLACATPFRLLPPGDPVVAATLAQVERRLVTGGGGVHRHPEDTYYGGGAWPLLSALLGLHYLAVGRRAAAERQLRWIAGTANAAGDLPEQVARHLLHPAARREWLQRWGPPASPLLWSHAMYLLLAFDLGVPAPRVGPATDGSGHRPPR